MSTTLETLQKPSENTQAYRFTITNFQIKETMVLYLSSCNPIGETNEDNCTYKYFEISTSSQYFILCIGELGNGEIVPSIWARVD